jgi:hypothetical protein
VESALQCLTGLQELMLYDTGMDVERVLVHITALKHLTCFGFESRGRLESLQRHTLEAAPSLQQLSSLQKLHLKSRSFANDTPEAVAAAVCSLTQLTELDWTFVLFSNDDDDDDFLYGDGNAPLCVALREKLPQLVRLQSIKACLGLTHDDVSFLKGLESLSALRVVEIENGDFSWGKDHEPPHNRVCLSGLTALTKLAIDHGYISHACAVDIIRSLQGMVQLRELTIISIDEVICHERLQKPKQ